MIIRNLTPHAIRVLSKVGPITIEPDGDAPRLARHQRHLGEVDGINVVRARLGSPEGLPEEEDGVILVVSAVVANHLDLESRGDLASPGRLIRNSVGTVTGCEGFAAGPGMARRFEPTGQIEPTGRLDNAPRKCPRCGGGLVSAGKRTVCHGHPVEGPDDRGRVRYSDHEACGYVVGE